MHHPRHHPPRAARHSIALSAVLARISRTPTRTPKKISIITQVNQVIDTKIPDQRSMDRRAARTRKIVIAPRRVAHDESRALRTNFSAGMRLAMHLDKMYLRSSSIDPTSVRISTSADGMSGASWKISRITTFLKAFRPMTSAVFSYSTWTMTSGRKSERSEAAETPIGMS
jgi:hypothetical protein